MGCGVVPVTLKFELGRDICTLHRPAKFHHPVFNCLEAIVLTDAQRDAAENIHLVRNATLVRVCYLKDKMRYPAFGTTVAIGLTTEWNTPGNR